MARLTVWGVNLWWHGGQRRAIVAAPNKKAAALAFDITPYYLGMYGGPTGNQFELELAKASPGVVFVHLADASASAERGEWVAVT